MRSAVSHPTALSKFYHPNITHFDRISCLFENHQIRFRNDIFRRRGDEKAKQEEQSPIRAKEVAKILDVSENCVRNWTSNKSIKHHK